MNKTMLLSFLDKIALPYKARRFVCENFNAEHFVCHLDEYKNIVIDNLGEAVYLKLKNAISVENIENFASELQNYGIKVISVTDKEYPESLKEIDDFPICLYYKGDISLLKEKCIAIIGTRKPTFYGRDVTSLFAKELCRGGMVTVSGLAYGLDSEVAISSLDVKGKTIAVLGGGLDSIYPAENQNLADKIVENGGLIISEYPIFRRPTQYSFLERNRIISGISLGVVVVEAGKRSGTFNTIRHAIDQGKEIFAIPGSIFSQASEGVNDLICEIPDVFTTSPKQILKRFKIEQKSVEDDKKKLQVKDDEKLIVETLYEGEMDFDTLQEKTGISSKCLISLLTRMEISGLIKKLPGNFYCLWKRQYYIDRRCYETRFNWGCW